MKKTVKPIQSNVSKPKHKLPTATELAIIAGAFIAKGDNVEFAPSSAFCLWRECRNMIDVCSEVEQDFEEMAHLKFPLDFEALLKHLMPEVKNCDRLRIFKEYLKHRPSNESDYDIQKELPDLRSEKFDMPTLRLFKNDFDLWRQTDISEKRSKARKPS